MRLRFLLLAALPAPLLAQTPRDSVITISTTRSAKIAPDRVSLYLVVEGTAETPADAIARVETKLKAIAEALKTFGSRVKLDPPVAYGVGPNVTGGGYPSGAPSTNVARSVVRAQLNGTEQTAQIVAAAIGAGAANSSSLTFESSVADSVRRARIGEALGVARVDAEAIASSLGGRLGSLVSASSSGGPFSYQGPTTLNFDNRFGQQVQPPEIMLNVSVSVQYRLVR